MAALFGYPIAVRIPIEECPKAGPALSIWIPSILLFQHAYGKLFNCGINEPIKAHAPSLFDGSSFII